MTAAPLLELEDLEKIYPTKSGQLHAVDGVNLTIARGESLGLVGESGCGKSTLVRVLSRLIDPTAGAIRIDGQSIGEIPARQFGRHDQRKRIQVVFQDPTDSLNPQFRIFDSIADPLRRLGGRTSRAEVTEAVNEAARITRLPEELLSRYPHQLSGGQKARVGIARAIILRPDLLILDEPTSALDVSVQVVILQLLGELRETLGMSYLFVSHDLNVVKLVCDRVAVMYLGKIIECAPVKQIFERPAHPYTHALLSAIPGSDAQGRVRLNGEPRSPIDPDPNVCRFHGRCPIGQDLCARAAPPLTQLGAHSAACHFRLDQPQDQPQEEIPA
ncbi:oligopeptide/dipeptide ABC transporter ATP-binding protein [Pseudooceanicola aestuarii]|uniref:oligopeptide/dipeptide ABC transporter ATP-binding protein n=1 Tax=Pseudooceanicola aestuarii TaxID=2697319 RepID=UPI0013D70F32|nr:ABC transporter ATP-binding protein [Pseudooceanicola aestuarii]